jgi:hypothetical protein
LKHPANQKSNLPQAEVRIPVADLGYRTPGTLPAFDHRAMVGVYFIDANRLLFTFDAKGLLHRDSRCSGADSQRVVHAVVLDIPTGKIEKQADWELYDFAGYLWSLGHGQFLLRQCLQLSLLDSTLALHPLIEPSSQIDSIGFSPDFSTLVIEQEAAGPVSLPKTDHPFEHPPAHKVDVEFVRLNPLAIVARLQIPLPATVPIVDQGILESLIAPHNRWTIDIQPFQGGDRKIVSLSSTCMPKLTPLTNTVIAAGTCAGSSDRSFQGFDVSGNLLWQIPLGSDRREPRFLLTRNGAHFAIESLHTNRPVAPLDPLSSKDIDADAIDIYDTLTGLRIGGLRTTPIYTAGQNADFSPDGTRLVVLHNGALEIYPLSELEKNRQ